MNAVLNLELLKSRTASYAAAGVIAILLFMLLSVPVFEAFNAEHHVIAASVLELSNLRAEAAAKPVVQARLTELQARMTNLTGAVQAKTAALALSQLQQALESLVSANGGNVRSAQMLPTVKLHDFEVLAIQYDLTVPMSKLRDLVYAVESHTPYLFISDASIAGTTQPAGSQQIQDPALDVRWTVRAYRWGGAR